MPFRCSQWLFVIVVPLVAISCTHPLTYTTTFDPAEVAWSKGAGQGTISGQALSIGRGVAGNDVVVTCKGGRISLIPKSKRADEEFQAFYGSLESGTYVLGTVDGFKTNGDPRMSEAARSAPCDDSGKFSFTGLPDGEYFLSALIYQNSSSLIVTAGSQQKPVKIGAAQRAVGIMKSVKIVGASHTEITLSAPFPLHSGEYLTAF